MKYGVIGEHLPHSFSKLIHEKIETYPYEICEIAKTDLDAFLCKKEFSGINVTIPYKEAVIPYLDEIDPAAKAIGAVNTVVNKNGRLYGYNTDFSGLSALISHAGLSLANRHVLILGTGGTAKTAKAVARKSGAASVMTVSRRQTDNSISYADAYRLGQTADILINTTPGGMFPQLDALPADAEGNSFDLSRFPSLEGVVDVVYNPLRTRLQQEAMSLGIPACGGLYMLIAQAVYAAACFTGKHYPDELIDRVYHEIQAEKENIVLIGMPASGKSSVGKLLAAKTGKTLIDTDEEIVKYTEKDIPTIFKTEGETAFRRYESEIIASLADQNGLIIATGGGAVLKEENRQNLSYNGRLYFLDRSPEKLIPTADRPTASDNAAILARYAERYAIYTEAADITLDGDKTPEEIADRLLFIHLHKEDSP